MATMLNALSSSSTIKTSLNPHLSSLTPRLKDLTEVNSRALSRLRRKNATVCLVTKEKQYEELIVSGKDDGNENAEEFEELGLQKESLLFSFSPVSLLLLGALPVGTSDFLIIVFFGFKLSRNLS